MKLVSILHAIVIIIGTTLLSLNNMPHQSISFGIGAIFIYLNALLIAIAWTMIFKKKLVALAGSLIVIKYAILGIITYYVVKTISDSLIWFVIGVFSFSLPALGFAIVRSNEKRGNDVI